MLEALRLVRNQIDFRMLETMRKSMLPHIELTALCAAGDLLAASGMPTASSPLRRPLRHAQQAVYLVDPFGVGCVACLGPKLDLNLNQSPNPYPAEAGS